MKHQEDTAISPTSHMTTPITIALLSVSTVFASAGVGAYARWRGVLSQSGARTVEKLVQEIFTPGLVLHKVLPHVSGAMLVQVWPLALMCMITVFLGLVMGRFVGLALRLQSGHRGILMVAVAFPNAFATPLTLMLTLSDQPVFQSDATPTASAVADRATQLFLFSYVVWLLARWAIGYPILTGGVTSARSLLRKVLNPPVIACLVAVIVGAISQAASICTEGCIALQPLATAADYVGRCMVPATLLTLGAAVAEAYASRSPGESNAPLAKHDSCGLTPSDSSQTPRASDHAVAAAVESGASPNLAGDAASDATAADPNPPSPQRAGLPMSALVAILLLRQVVGPMVGVAVATALRYWCGLVDPVLLMVLLLQSAGPPMINIAVMAGLAGGGDCSRECARVLLLTYSASIITWCVSITAFLSLLSGFGLGASPLAK